MINKEKRKMAQDVKDKYNLDAPLNDIEQKIQDITESVVSDEQAEKIIVKHIKEENVRLPSEEEILVYDLPSELKDLYVDPS